MIVDFDVRDGLLFVSLANIGEGSACEVMTTFDPPFSGLEGSKDIGGMNVFRRVEFMAPGPWCWSTARAVIRLSGSCRA